MNKIIYNDSMLVNAKILIRSSLIIPIYNVYIFRE